MKTDESQTRSGYANAPKAACEDSVWYLDVYFVKIYISSQKNPLKVFYAPVTKHPTSESSVS